MSETTKKKKISQKQLEYRQRGKDPFWREKLGFQRARAQAKFRGQKWLLGFDEYWELWQDHWNDRGRGIDQMCMIRLDYTKPWQWDNVKMVSRRDYLKKEGIYHDINGVRSNSERKRQKTMGVGIYRR